MLEQIYIKNFAIIDQQTVTFKPGFNVLSGETGAGKSILIDALGLQLGDRADSNWIRANSTRCDIHSTFTLSPNSQTLTWLQENELDDEDNSETENSTPICQLRRTLSNNGKSKCYINGIPTTVNQTKILGEQLVDIHGQHAHQSLTQSAKQLLLLDNYANHPDLIASTRHAYQQYQTLLDLQNQLGQGQHSLIDKVNLLQYQLQELQALNIQENEFQQLSTQQKNLANAAQIFDTINQINQLVDNDEHSIQSQLTTLSRLTEKLVNLDSRASEVFNLVEQASIHLEEAQSTLHHYASDLQLEPEILDEIESRMGKLHELSRKHQVEPEHLLIQQTQLEKELATLQQQQAQLENLTTDLVAAESHYANVAQTLSDSRKQQADKLCQFVSEQFTELGMDKAQFTINFDSPSRPQANGQDKVLFLFSGNPGQAPKALHKIASGGELSRISLAIQVASMTDKTDATLIFDEVDSGIGGPTAEVVGRLLKTLSRYNQVICVTHLAQVAAFSDHHIFIHKQVTDEQTYTQFQILDEAAKTKELARMSGGIEMDKKTLEHAQHIRQNALQFSQKLSQTQQKSK